jgi:thiamine transport system permease protein
VQWLILLVGVAGFLLPLLSVLADGLTAGVAELLVRPVFWWSALSSFVIASLSALLTLVLAMGLALGRAATAQPVTRTLLGVPPYAYLAVPAVVLALGFFLLVRNAGIAPASAAPAVVVLGNSLLALPFAIATLGPPLEAIARTRGKLIRSLGLSGTRQFLAIEYPLLGRDLGIMLALAFCFSLGDLGVIALFGTENFQTLPLMMFRSLGAYRTNDAAAIAAVLLIGTVVAFAGLPRIVERIANARR